ncbi:MAG: tape measure protein, partial [Propionibacteriaceae bacterium]|nr:tape measure protein [Propionibacteriaceae bacterium]
MANEIAAVYVSVIPETSKIAPGIKNAFKGVDGAAANAGKGLGAKLAGALGTTLKAGVAGAGVAAGAALGVSITKGLGRLSSLDQANAKLKGLGYTGGEITRVMESVSGSVKGTAFGLDEAAGSAAKLGAVGVETGQQMDRAMKLTADIAAQAGTGMDDVSSIMAKIAGAGKVTGETLAQLDDRATGAGAAIAEHLGVSIEEMREQVSAGTVDFETFQKAMEDHLGGAAQATGETVKGSFDNMGAAMGRFGEKLMSPAFIAAPSIFSAVGTAFDGINEAIGPASERIGQILAPAMESVATVIETRLTPMLADGAGKLGDLAVALTEKAVDPALWERIGDIFGSIRDA